MCTPEDRMRKFHLILLNQAMKEHLALPPSETSPVFYQSNTFNKPLSLTNFQYKRRCCDCRSCRSFSNRCCKMFDQDSCKRTGRCFPEAAPIACPPMVHRSKFSSRPKSSDDRKLPTRKTLFKDYTLKIDKRFLRKDD